MFSVDDAAIGRLLLLIRRAGRWRQDDLASKADVSQDAVSRVERGQFDAMSLRRIRRIFEAAGASFVCQVHWRGSHLDRLRDERHAALVSAFVGRARTLGWEIAVEVTYSEYGERGSIDILCSHRDMAAVLVVEVKSELVSIEATLRKLDEKARLASTIVFRTMGWRPRTVGRVLVIEGLSSARRQVERHTAVVDTSLPARAAEIRRWMRRPAGPLGGVWFISLTRPVRVKQRPVGRRRVRRQPSTGA